MLGHHFNNVTFHWHEGLCYKNNNKAQNECFSERKGKAWWQNLTKSSTSIGFGSQLCENFIYKPKKFPKSLVLVGKFSG